MAIPCVRFGPFTFDPAAGELWKRDRRVKLQEQPRLILDLLIARRGQLVTREELRQLLWPADTFVDYEHGLNAAIKRLRDVLSDSAERPRFIDTVPRRGYVFIGATLADEVTPPPANADHVEDPPAAGDVPRQFAFLRSGLLVTGVLVGSAAALVLFLAWRSRPIDAGGPVPLPRRLTQLTFDRGLTYQPAVSPDGHVVVYASDRGGAGDLDLWSQRDDGSTVRLTKGPMDEHEVSFAPDGNRIVFRSERDGGGIYVMGAQSGGQPLKLAPGGHNPYVSPDGRFVAYWTGGPDTDACYGIAGMNRVFIVPIEGGTPRQIVPQFPAACWPVWAPDSRHVLITGQEKPDQDLTWFVAPIDGGAPINAGSRLEARYHFAHLPRQELWVGTTLVFSVWRASPKNLWATHVDPRTWRVSDVAEELTTATEDQAAASVSRTGQLVYSALSHTLALWALSLDAAHGRAPAAPERLTNGLEYDRYPTISSDGSTLCFARVGSNGQAVWVRSLRTGLERQLVPADGAVGLPVMSPDGSRIAFPHQVRDVTAIEVIRPDGGAPERVSTACGLCGVTGWSHDNRQLLVSDNDGSRGVVIRRIDLATGRQHVIAGAVGRDLFEGTWSSDDRWLLFIAVVNDRARVFVAPRPQGDGPVDTASWIPVTSGSGWDDKPRWSPVGSLVYFTSDRDGFRCVWAQRLDVRSRRPIGEPFAVHHAHRAAVSLRNLLVPNLGLAVARDRLVFNAGTDTANIWSMPFEPK